MSTANFDFSHESDLTLETLIDRVESYLPKANIDLLTKAYLFAEKAHSGQKRSSGEDFIIHPMNVANLLTKLQMDLDSIIAGLLHDVVEDCSVEEEELEREFSKNISQIVIGLTKISKIQFKTKEEGQAENFRKMVVAMAKDIRVIIVKLADRMHNMRTLQYVSEERQKNIAKETMDIYVPLAGRLGIHSVKAELEDLCLRFLQPEIYYTLAEKVAMKKSERERYIKDVVSIIKDKLDEYSVQADVIGRSKHFYSIYKKLQQRSVEFEQIQDILAFRIITNNITQCYKCLGVIHSSFTPIPGRFKDYIAIPKINNYQSLHTTVIGPKAERIEIQIRTYEMDEIAETGVAAHWKYKEGMTFGKMRPNLTWVDDLVEYNKSMQSSSEFMTVVKDELDSGGVFIFTPNGDVMELPSGATPLDFAYTIHTEVGNLCVGAKINGKIVPLKYRLKSGDVVEILTSKTQTPSKDWLKLVRTTRAKTKIKQYLLKVEREKQKIAGEELLEKAFRLYSTSVKSLKKSGDWDRLLKTLHFKIEDELYVHVGAGKYTPKDILKELFDDDEVTSTEDGEKLSKDLEKLQNDYQKVTLVAQKSTSKDNAVIVDGLDDVLVRMAKCCNPIPGDPIIGHVTRGRGITIHTISCKKKGFVTEEEGHANSGGGISGPNSASNRLISVHWNDSFAFKHPVSVRIVTLDRPGILAKISKTINNLGINIRAAVAKSLPDQKGNFIFEVEVKDYSELLKVMDAIKSHDDVISVVRV
ncbi:MAG: bifunctional (p)ppGpp synthetase/guanosine-3',5'-bis(diphosphate) 3'-pyrophosphohydrolase [Oligoflexia bacterium]|nr:bifunctional (p)ppGpp synthetase/guanosine-3',5'-bis(diphosphate) 3'-pyrophosphohydrolase [Oligoflexia bacterium]